MVAFIVGIFAAIIVGATATFGYVVYVDHSGRTARKRRLTVRNYTTPLWQSISQTVYKDRTPRLRRGALQAGFLRLQKVVYLFLRVQLLRGFAR